MNNKDLLNSLGDIDDKFVKESRPKKKKVKLGKWIGVAASIAIIAVIGVVATIHFGVEDNDKQGQPMTEPGIMVEKVPEIGIDQDGIDFYYYVCGEDGSYSLIGADKTKIELEGAIKRFFELNKTASLTLTEIKYIKEEAKEWSENGLSHFVPQMNTFEVYMEGEGLNDDIAKGLVNTVGLYISDYVGNDYVKLFLNNEAYLIGGEMPDYGYAEFSLSVKEKVEVKDEFAYYVHIGEGDYKKLKEDKIATSRMDVEDVVKKFLAVNGLDDTTLLKIDVSEDSYKIYMDGDDITEDMAKGLVNTVLEYSSCNENIRFAKMFVNNKEIMIDNDRTNKGYQMFELDIEYDWEEDDAPDPEEMVDISFVIKDETGKAMKNIAYRLEFVSGEKGNYQPGKGITDSTGKFTRSVHPNAVYILYLQKKNANIYSTFERWTSYEEYIYEELPIIIEVDGSFTKEIIWKDEDVIDICEPENAIIIDVTQIYTGSYEDVFVQLISDYGSQIQLGYLGADGKMIWNESQNGWYYLQLQWFDKSDGGKLTHSESFKIDIEDGEITVDEEWDGEMKIYE